MSSDAREHWRYHNDKAYREKCQRKVRERYWKDPAHRARKLKYMTERYLKQKLKKLGVAVEGKVEWNVG